MTMFRTNTRASSRGLQLINALSFLLFVFNLAVYFYNFTHISNLYHLEEEVFNDAAVLRKDVEEDESASSNIDSVVDERVKSELSRLREETIQISLQEAEEIKREQTTNKSPRFPEIQFAGMTRIPNHDFLHKFDFGTPIHSDTNRQILLLYNKRNAIPTSITASARRAIENEDENGIPSLSAHSATGKCNNLNVVTYRDDVDCVALVKNFENYHVQKWEQDNDGHFEVKSRVNNVSPKEKTIEKHWEILRTYFESYHEVMDKLKPIAEKVAVNNTIIVLTCNLGQRELLMNFICNCRAKGLDTSHILVFPTDEETKKLAEDMGLIIFYDEKNLGRIPKDAATAYGDDIFAAVMFAKVLCVQVINKLGYDLLFQDVDVIWRKNPLEYFHDTKNELPNDIYLQDDGNRDSHFAPYYGNSGFYYVRSNERTQYFFTSLLYGYDMILECKTDQKIFNEIIAEHVSLFGLKVKVFDNLLTEEFPSGFHYHMDKKRMKKIVKGETAAHTFHMNWTMNKHNKVKFFQQMGEWYLKDSCIQAEDAVLSPSCCLADANIICHYSDKPSIIPCTDSDPLQEGAPPFW